jgi:hypothetical protein
VFSKGDEMAAGNIFQVKKSYGPEVPSNIRKSLSNFRTTGKEFDLIRQACEDLCLEYDCPGVTGSATAHFTFPKYKFAIFFHRSRGDVARKSKEFAVEGWRLVPLMPTTIVNLTLEQVREQLKTFLNSLKANQVKTKKSTR